MVHGEKISLSSVETTALFVMAILATSLPFWCRVPNEYEESVFILNR